MDFSTITLIGCGSLGGYVAQKLSNIPLIEKMILIDHDIVEDHNIELSIYKKCHVGHLKVNSLKQIINIENPHINVRSIPIKYNEEDIVIPNFDLTIDCRDVTYDRGNSIDIRLSVSSRYLLVDSRRNIRNDFHREGKYTEKLSRLDLENCGIIFASLVQDGTILELLNKQSVHKICLDSIKFDLQQECCKFNNSNMIPINDKLQEKILNFDQNVDTIIAENKNNTLELVVRDSNNPIHKFIPKNQIRNYEDVIKILNQEITSNNQFNFYILSIINNKIEIIPEIGAA